MIVEKVKDAQDANLWWCERSFLEAEVGPVISLIAVVSLSFRECRESYHESCRGRLLGGLVKSCQVVLGVVAWMLPVHHMCPGPYARLLAVRLTRRLGSSAPLSLLRGLLPPLAYPPLELEAAS